MEINVTLIVQMLIFLAFIAFTMRFVWPPLSKALEERQDKIADGLAAAERGWKDLELAQHRAQEEMQQAKTHAAEIIEKAHNRATQMIEEARDSARQEGLKLAKVAEEQIAHQVNRAKESLRKQLAALAIAGAEKIIMHTIDEQASSALLDNLINEI